MAYLDITADHSYGRYNIRFASIAGLDVAVYWSCVMNVMERVRDKKTYDENGFFKLDRKYVESKTTLTKEDQLECDEILKELGLVDICNTDNCRIRCDTRKFITMITEDNTIEIKAISRKAKKAEKEVVKENKNENKKRGIVNRLKGRITETDADLVKLYCSVIDVCYDKGMMSNSQIELFQDTIDRYTSDKQVKAEILKLAITYAYKNADWSINLYEKNNGVKKRADTLGEQKVATSVNTENTF